MLTFVQSCKTSDLSVVFCFASLCKKDQQSVLFCKVSIEKATYFQLLTSFRRSNEMFVDAFIECDIDHAGELDVFCRSFAIQNTSASLYSILIYQIKFPPPKPLLLNFQFSKF